MLSRADEYDSEVLRRSRIFVDRLEQTLEEAGDMLIPIRQGQFSAEKIAGTICDVITGKVKGRESDSQLILFKSVGIAIEDVSVAKRIYEAALQKGAGKEISF
jgi:ornithine cyclodeaminase